MHYSALQDQLTQICMLAGTKILEVYNDHSTALSVEVKEDASPLTKADKEAHLIIVKGLGELPLPYSVLSEEGRHMGYDERKNWEYYWLVDPLDGTKEFIKRNGQFTVNVALIENKIPVMGCIYAPVTGELFFGLRGKGAFKKVANASFQPIFASTRKDNWVAVGSSSHASEEEVQYLSSYPVTETLKSGSSLKFCRIAEGTADVYVRTGPTMEWDTAAGHCIAEAAGAAMHRLDGTPFLYNKENLLNPGFVCLTKSIHTSSIPL